MTTRSRRSVGYQSNEWEMNRIVQDRGKSCKMGWLVGRKRVMRLESCRDLLYLVVANK